MKDNHIEKDITIKNELGIHAQPLNIFLTTANSYSSKIRVSKDGMEVNAKSFLGMLTISAKKGETITLVADGEDAQEAIQKLVGLIENEFNE